MAVAVSLMDFNQEVAKKVRAGIFEDAEMGWKVSSSELSTMTQSQLDALVFCLERGQVSGLTPFPWVMVKKKKETGLGSFFN